MGRWGSKGFLQPGRYGQCNPLWGRKDTVLQRSSGPTGPLEFCPYFEGIGLPVDLFCCTLAQAGEVPLARWAAARGILLAGRSEGPWPALSASGNPRPPEKAHGDEADGPGQENQTPEPEPV